MAKRIKPISVSVLIILIISSCFFSAFAVNNESTYEKLFDNQDSIISVSFRGDTALYPANSIEGIISAANNGADIVSANVMKTKDGVLVLCEDKSLSNILATDKDSVSELTFSQIENLYLLDQSSVPTEYKMCTLINALDVCEMGVMLLLDFDWSLADEIYSLLNGENALSKVILRTKQDPSKIEKWLSAKPIKPIVMAVYDGNIVFNAVSHLSKMSAMGMPAVQYQSKNHFNVMYGDFVSKRYSDGNNPRALVSTCDPDFCGQRNDSEDGWNELIKKGFSIIETNNIVSLGEYIDSIESLRVSLSALTEKAACLDASVYSQVSADNLKKAMENAKSLLNDGVVSRDELQSAQSALILSMNKLALNTGEDAQRGALNITFGKVLAAVLVGAAILAAQIFVHKMQRKKEK